MLLREQEVYDEYALSHKLSKPFFIIAQEASATLGVDQRTVEYVKKLDYPTYGHAKRVRIGQNPS
jgi:hypothetical protein